MDVPSLSPSSVSIEHHCTPKTNQTPVFINQDILQSPPRKRPYDDNTNIGALLDMGSPGSMCSSKMHSSLPMSTPPTSTPPPVSASEVLACRKRNLEAKARVRHMPREHFQPYKHRIGPPPLELCFAMRSLGRSSYTDLGYEDVVKGKAQFQRGLLLLSDEVMNKAYEAKMASKMCILDRLALTQSEICAMEKHSDFLCEALTNCGISQEEHIALNHAAYADEMVALTITDMQLNQILNAFRMQMPESDSDESSFASGSPIKMQLGSDSHETSSASGSSNGDISDDLVYEDDESSMKARRPHPYRFKMPSRPASGHIMGSTTNHDGELPQNPSFHSELPQASILFSPAHGLPGSHHPSQLPHMYMSGHAGPSTGYSHHPSGNIVDNWGDTISWEDAPQQEYENCLPGMWLGSHEGDEVTGMGFEDSEGLPQAQHNDDAAGLYYGQQEAAEGTAGSYYQQQGAASQENAQLNDLQDYFTNGEWTTNIPSSWNENMAASHLEGSSPQTYPDWVMLANRSAQTQMGLSSNTTSAAIPAPAPLKHVVAIRPIRGVETVPPTPEIPPTPSPPPPHVHEPVPTPHSNSNPLAVKVNRTQHKVIFNKARTAICRIMFTETAVPCTKKEQRTIIRRAINEAKELVLGHQIPVDKLHMTQKLVEVMSHTRFAFRAHTSRTVELGFGLVPEILGGPNNKAHKHDAIKKLLDGDWIDVLHRMEKSPDSDNTLVHYFKNRVIVDAIIYVIWRDLRCSHLVDELEMDPVFRLASAAFKIVFLEHADGVYKKCPAHAEQFAEAYEETINSIANTVHSDRALCARYLLLCKCIVA
ncbi:hypothetical protein PAXRUDRAFT_16801 [Paxillus rubicundulus Ve08.2h10]|uniref:DUF6532 domain-containing protein n=1 Tax=Paxillus rubicundulus Ve08.2h10 TaxID=930991 RepID=A0A0D0D4M3_9AGAM|nr:hypothetical protein PAXRUDRAFT_16801 [Paxillus rubicundulus Ve08.2h10]